MPHPKISKALIDKPSHKERITPFFVICIVLGFALFLRLATAQNELDSLTIFAHSMENRLMPSRNRPIQDQVLPPEGFQTKITLGDTVQKMVAAGIIDQQKLADSYSARGGIPPEMQNLLSEKSSAPLHLTRDNAKWLINLLWPLGLANRMTINEQSPIAKQGVSGFASTGGWTLGREDGPTYFNSYPLLSLTAEQEARIKTLTDNIYRPCCNNSAFFQDCNHGSAALGLVELGVAENLSDQEIYSTVLHFNSFWFPQQYLEIAAFFQKTKGQAWVDVDPKVALARDYSSITGWMTNVDSVISKTPGAIPTIDGGSSCST